MDAGNAAQMTMWLLTEAPKQESAMQRNRLPDQDLALIQRRVPSASPA